jgi:predicted nucleic acid-binding Zn ribbon protein
MGANSMPLLVAAKTCTRCGTVKPLDAFHKNGHAPDGRRSNCKECANAATRQFQRDYKMATGQHYRRNYSYDHACERCGKTWTSAEPKTRFCSQSCASLSARWTRTCHGCGKEWQALAPTALWCSEACRVLVGQRKRALHAQVVPWSSPAGWVHPRYRVVAAVLTPLRRCWYAGRCACCNDWFIHDLPQTATCSPKCQRRMAKARRRALKKAAFVAPVSPRKIFDRDSWTCRLCRKPVLRSAVAPHPLAPTVDHIVPLDAGGTHEPSNVQCAHFLCNSRKGNRGGGQLLLIG